MQKNIIFLILMLLFAFFVTNMETVEAYSITNNEVVYSLAEGDEKGCEGILGSPSDSTSVAYFLQQIFNLIKYAGPILCIVLSVADFVKATASQDKDLLTKAASKTGKRIVWALVLFFVPVLIEFVFPLLGWYGTCGIS